MEMSDKNEMEAPGVFVIAIVFLVVFIVVWFAHLKWLANVWEVR